MIDTTQRGTGKTPTTASDDTANECPCDAKANHSNAKADLSAAKANLCDAQAFSQAVSAMEGDLYRVARTILRSDADIADAMQETALRAWRGVHRLRDAEIFDRWLIKILINQCRTMSRKQRRIAEQPLEEWLSAQDEDYRDSALDIRRALDKLPEKLRLPLVLHHVMGYDIGEVARLVGTTKSAAASRIHRAREKMRALLKEEI